MVDRLHVGLQFRAGFAGLPAVGAVEAQVQDGGRRSRTGGVGFVRLDNGIGFASGRQQGHLILMIQMDVPLQEELHGEGLRAEGALEERNGPWS